MSAKDEDQKCVVGIVGAGTMGTGIAQVVAAAGVDVILVDEDEQALQRSAEMITTRVSRTEGAGSIKPTRDVADIAMADVVIEAIVERLDDKRALFTVIDGIVSEDALLATNTSSLSIAEIAAGTRHPDRAVGIHFMNPAPLMKLVEVVKADATSNAAIERAEAFVARIGKKPVRVADRPCFIVNRLLMPLINEAARALGEGVATAEAIDAAMKLGANFPMGPLHLADLIGIDIVVEELRVLSAGLGTHHEPALELVARAESGDLGRKTGRGFFEYPRPAPR